MCAIYSGPSCNFPQPREANAFYAASIAYWYIVQSLAFGSPAPNPHSAATASLREAAAGRAFRIPQHCCVLAKSVLLERAREGIQSTRKKAPRIPSGALLCRAENALVNYNKVRIARADYPLRVYKAVHVNCDPAAVQEREVRAPDQSEMARPTSLDEELFRMPPKTEH